MAGSTITAVGGHAVATPSALTGVLATHRPAGRVAITWTDPDGAGHHATVTLGAGPAD